MRWGLLPSLYIYCDPLCHQNILHVLALLFPSKYFKIFPLSWKLNIWSQIGELWTMRVIIVQRNLFRKYFSWNKCYWAASRVQALYCTIWNIWIWTSHIVTRTHQSAATSCRYIFFLSSGLASPRSVWKYFYKIIFLDWTCHMSCEEVSGLLCSVNKWQDGGSYHLDILPAISPERPGQRSGGSSNLVFNVKIWRRKVVKLRGGSMDCNYTVKSPP